MSEPSLCVPLDEYTGKQTKAALAPRTPSAPSDLDNRHISNAIEFGEDASYSSQLSLNLKDTLETKDLSMSAGDTGYYDIPQGFEFPAVNVPTKSALPLQMGNQGSQSTQEGELMSSMYLLQSPFTRETIASHEETTLLGSSVSLNLNLGQMAGSGGYIDCQSGGHSAVSSVLNGTTDNEALADLQMEVHSDIDLSVGYSVSPSVVPQSCDSLKDCDVKFEFEVSNVINGTEDADDDNDEIQELSSPTTTFDLGPMLSNTKLGEEASQSDSYVTTSLFHENDSVVACDELSTVDQDCLKNQGYLEDHSRKALRHGDSSLTDLCDTPIFLDEDPGYSCETSGYILNSKKQFNSSQTISDKVLDFVDIFSDADDLSLSMSSKYLSEDSAAINAQLVHEQFLLSNTSN